MALYKQCVSGSTACVGFAVLCFAGLIGVHQRLQKSKLCLLRKVLAQGHTDKHKQAACTENDIHVSTQTSMCPQKWLHCLCMHALPTLH